MSIRIKYQPLLSVEVRRRNLPSDPNAFLKPSGVFRLSPTPSTLSLFQSHQILHKQRENGIELFFKSNPLLVDALQITNPLEGRTTLSFFVFPEDFNKAQAFFGDQNNANKHLYINNLDNNALAPTASTLSSVSVDLTIEAQTKTITNTQYVSLKQKRFSLVTTKDGNGQYPYTEVIIRDAGSQGISDFSISLNTDQSPETTQTKIDLSNYPDGRFDLFQTDNTLIESIYLVDALPRAALGILDLFWDGIQATTNDDFRKYYIAYDEVTSS